MTKQDIYKKYARYLGKMNKQDRDFSKVCLTIGYLTKKQSRSETFKKLNEKHDD